MTTIDEIRERWSKTTPGPWRHARHVTHEVEAPPNQLIADCGTVGRCSEDADAIAAAPADIAFLLAEVERLRAQVADLQAASDLACEMPASHCDCPGCSLARERGGA